MYYFLHFVDVYLVFDVHIRHLANDQIGFTWLIELEIDLKLMVIILLPSLITLF